MIYPSRTLLAENPVSVVDKVVDKRGTRKQAEAYLQYLYSEAGQEIAAKHHLRPRNDKVLAKYAKAFPKVNTFTVDEVFGGWTKAQKDHFNDGAPTYDREADQACSRSHLRQGGSRSACAERHEGRSRLDRLSRTVPAESEHC